MLLSQLKKIKQPPGRVPTYPVHSFFSQEPDEKKAKKQGNQNTVQYRSKLIGNTSRSGASDDVDYTKDKDVATKDMVPEEPNDLGKSGVPLVIFLNLYSQSSVRGMKGIRLACNNFVAKMDLQLSLNYFSSLPKILE